MADSERDRSDRMLREAQYITTRLRNSTGSAEGTLLPPRQQGSFRVPFVNNLKITQVAQVFGGTQFTLTWDEPGNLATFIPRYNVYYATVAVNAGIAPGQYQGPVAAKGSPATVTITTKAVTRVVFCVQTELNSGLKSDLLSSPTVTGNTIAAAIGTSEIPAGTVTRAQNASNTAGAIDAYDATGLPTVIPPVATVGRFLTNAGASAPPTYNSLVGDVSGTVGATLLATVNANTGTFGDATHTPQITLDGKGRTTAASSVLITGTTPGGAAGGALTGTYPNPTLANLTTVGAIPYVSATGVLNQDQTANGQLFWDSTNHRIGIGIAAPAQKFHTVSDGTVCQLRADTYSAGSLGSQFGFNFARGSVALPTKALANDQLGSIGAFGYGATGFSTAAKALINLYAAEDWSDTAQGTYIAFETTAKLGVVRSEKVRIDDAGQLGVGTTSPSALLSVGSTSQFRVNTSGLITQQNNEATVGNGVATVRGYVSATAQGASIGSTALVTSPAAGLYRVSIYLATSTAGTGSTSVSITFTDSVGAKTIVAVPAMLLTASNAATGSILIQVASGNINYLTTWATSGQYNVYITAERIQ